MSRYKLMPVAFMAISSFDFCSSPKVTSTAIRTLSGVMRYSIEGITLTRYSNGDQRDAIAHNVPQQLEEAEDKREHDECRQHQPEIFKELAKHVVVEDQRKSRSAFAQKRGALGSLCP